MAKMADNNINIADKSDILASF